MVSLKKNQLPRTKIVEEENVNQTIYRFLHFSMLSTADDTVITRVSARVRGEPTNHAAQSMTHHTTPRRDGLSGVAFYDDTTSFDEKKSVSSQRQHTHSKLDTGRSSRIFSKNPM
jgi:hypothetical protein